MNVKEWTDYVKKEHLPSLLETEYETYDEEEYEIEKTLIKEEQGRFVVKINDYVEIAYSYDGEIIKAIENSLPSDWKLTDFLKKEEKNKKPFFFLTIEKEKDFILIKTESDVRNGHHSSSQRVLHFGLNITEVSTKLPLIRKMMVDIKECLGENVSFKRGMLIKLFSREELTQRFGKNGVELMECIDGIDFSPRAYNGLTREGYETLFDIAWGTPEELDNIYQLGGPAKKEIINYMNTLNLPWNIKEKFSMYETNEIRYTNKGLRIYDEFEDRLGSNICVRESNTDENCVWIICKKGEETSLPRLNVEQAKRLRKALDEFIEENEN